MVEGCVQAADRTKRLAIHKLTMRVDEKLVDEFMIK